ncbi:MAG: hypothetical protein R2705_24085 [Ilumatobacteraceae bacterium]
MASIPAPPWTRLGTKAAESAKVYSWYPQRAGRPDLAVSHAQRAGASDDARVRQELAGLLSMQRVSQWTAERRQSSAHPRAPARP